MVIELLHLNDFKPVETRAAFYPPMPIDLKVNYTLFNLIVAVILIVHVEVCVPGCEERWFFMAANGRYYT